MCVCECVSREWREALGKTYVEKCLFFIRQMETDVIWREGKFVGPEGERRREGREGLERQKYNEENEASFTDDIISVFSLTFSVTLVPSFPHISSREAVN